MTDSQKQRAKELLHPQLLYTKYRGGLAKFKKLLITDEEINHDKIGLTEGEIRVFVQFKRKLQNLRQKLEKKQITLDDFKKQIQAICTDYTLAFNNI
ncbi:MAG: hypothetical protein AAB874_06640 [Patescibacteria group bacterium]